MAQAQGQDLQVIAQEGDQAPGLAEGTLYHIGFRKPVISGNGHIAFTATVRKDTNKQALFFGKPAELTAIAVQDDPAPGADGDVFCKFFGFINPSFSYIPGNDGSLVFTALVLPPGYVNSQCTSSSGRLGIWHYKEGLIQLVAIEDEQAADVADGLVYKDILDNDKYFRYRDGMVHFAAMLHNPDGAVDLGVSFWTGGVNDLHHIVTAGDVAPGFEPKTVSSPGKKLLVNGSGTSLLYSSLDGSGSDQVFWKANLGTMEVLLKSGTPAPEYGTGVSFYHYVAAQPYEWGLNDSGHSCYSIRMFHDDVPAVQFSTLWLDDGALRKVLASEEYSDTGLGESYGFTLLKDCFVNRNSLTLFRANAHSEEPAGTRTGLWTARLGDETADLTFVVSDSDTLLADEATFNTGDNAPSEAHINARDGVAFKVMVTGQDVAGDRDSIWLVNENGDQLLAIEGQTITDSHGILRTLGSTMEFGVGDVGTGNEDGRPSGLSDYDQVVLRSTLSGIGDVILVSPPCCNLMFKDGFESVQ